MNKASIELNKMGKLSSRELLNRYADKKKEADLLWEAYRESMNKYYISPLRG